MKTDVNRYMKKDRNIPKKTEILKQASTQSRSDFKGRDQKTVDL